MPGSHPGQPRPGLTKIHFDLEPDGNGWPPVSTESLWAEPAGDNEFQIDSIPWFIRNLSCGDIVEARAGDDGLLHFVAKVKSSGNLTVRVIPSSRLPMAESLRAVIETFSRFGVEAEGAAPACKIVALSIPPAADHRAILERLRTGVAEGTWEFEEGCVTDAWLAM